MRQVKEVNDDEMLLTRTVRSWIISSDVQRWWQRAPTVPRTSTSVQHHATTLAHGRVPLYTLATRTPPKDMETQSLRCILASAASWHVYNPQPVGRPCWHQALSYARANGSIWADVLKARSTLVRRYVCTQPNRANGTTGNMNTALGLK